MLWQDELLQQYSALVNRPFPDPYWNFYSGFYYWRGTIIAQGIAARYAAGQASNPMAKQFGEGTLAMWDVTKGYIKMLEDTLDPVDPVPVIGNIKQTDDYCHKLPPDVENQLPVETLDAFELLAGMAASPALGNDSTSGECTPQAGTSGVCG